MCLFGRIHLSGDGRCRRESFRIAVLHFFEFQVDLMHRRLSTRMIALSVALFFCATTTQFMLRARSRNGQSAPKSGVELIRRAEQLTDIRSGNAPSFRLIARVQAYDEKGKKKEGAAGRITLRPLTYRSYGTRRPFGEKRLPFPILPRFASRVSTSF